MTPTVADMNAAYDAWLEEQKRFDLDPRSLWSISRMAPLPPILAEYAVVSRDHLDKLEADHAEVAQLRADLVDVRANAQAHAEDAATFRQSARESGDAYARMYARAYELAESVKEARARLEHAETALTRATKRKAELAELLRDQQAQTAEAITERDTLDRAHRRVIEKVAGERDDAIAERDIVSRQLYKCREERSRLEKELTLGRPEITLRRRNGFTREVEIRTPDHVIVAHAHREEITGRGQRIDDALGVTSETVLA
ncbi:hypothetical protein [Rhodococcus opacus]|uniref:hypothetical protein n=1 Tax=Rhodococcus opacus TaxID=37919 RepID=UPI001C45676E|nr:hypothetical protein [Rhodococcus opacus]MBV6758381.1 hypothetical protein [Rhodococcus opacus]